jgi:cullin-4
LILETDVYYKRESRLKIEELEIGAYLRHVSQRLDEEQRRVQLYLSRTSHDGLANCVDKCFVGDFVDVILSKGILRFNFYLANKQILGAEKLFYENKIDDIKLLYQLFGRVKNARQSLKNSFVAYIKKVGRVMISNTDRDKSLVKDLMEMKAKLDNTISVCFENNEKFIQGERDAFNYFINVRANKPAELIAKFMDSKLRLGNKECSDDELDAIMDRVIVLFRFVDGNA